jgi:hypothetical protein
MVDSWPYKVSSKIHINGRRVSEPVRENKVKTTATEPEDEKDLKRARVVLSKGREVVGPGYSRLTSDAATVTDRGENLGNPSLVNWVSKTKQHYPSRVSQVSQDNSMDRQADRVSQGRSTDRWAVRVSRVGNTLKKMGGSSLVANTKSWVTENLANMESRVTQNSANTESWVTENSTNMKSRVTQNSANTESWVTQKIWLTWKTRLSKTRGGGGGLGTERRKMCCSKKKAISTVVPKRYYQDTKTQIGKDASKRVGSEKRRVRAGLLV